MLQEKRVLVLPISSCVKKFVVYRLSSLVGHVTCDPVGGHIFISISDLF